MRANVLLLLILLPAVLLAQNNCQKWCYSVRYGGIIKMVCCSYKEKPGMCSRQFFPSSSLLHSIKCYSDSECPWGFKCCPCDSSYICTPVLEPRGTDDEGGDDELGSGSGAGEIPTPARI